MGLFDINKKESFESIIKRTCFYVEYDSSLVSNEEALRLYKQSLNNAVDKNPALAPLLDEKKYTISQDAIRSNCQSWFIRIREYIDYEEERRRGIAHIKKELLNAFNV